MDPQATLTSIHETGTAFMSAGYPPFRFGESGTPVARVVDQRPAAAKAVDLDEIERQDSLEFLHKLVMG